ncbi:MAG: Uncharacterized protein Greene041679_117 [Parcubacteria group bacterium Greene0416_79]|nr:MAG: Uncharacterized protein Greene041679_117 [Parcubacteria group bacterium Greene0416_79]
MAFSKIESVHFIGIGGIGMSAIARMFLVDGKKVSGSDLADSEIVEALRKEGAEISIGQTLSVVPKNVDLIIYSVAIQVADPKHFNALKKLKIPLLSYAEALGEISRGKFTIAVSGTHGKTTTTAMLAKILIDAGLSPSVIIGSLMRHPKTGAQTNFIRGERDYFVVEADEYQRNFLTLSPNLLVITNIDEDHLDYYRDIDDICSAFSELAKRLPLSGAIITDFSDPRAARVVKEAGRRALDYQSFAKPIALQLPGLHNLHNARAALAAAAALGVSSAKATAFLADFDGVWRRFEQKGVLQSGALLYDDYAHNPRKVEALLLGAKEFFAGKRIVAVFQPHLYSRTKTLFNGFAKAFGNADEIIVSPIFPAREPFDASVSSKMLAEAIGKRERGKKVRCMNSFEAIAKYLRAHSGAGDVIITIGAGDIYKVADMIR